MEASNIYQPSEVELEILQILWVHQPATVRFVYEQMQAGREKPLSYTTILTYLQRMTKKEMVIREVEGKTHFYRAVPQETEVQKTLSQRLLDRVFKGSAKKLIMQALGQKKVSKEELDEIQKWLDSQKKQSDD
ncbi:MAG: BlaI/MecI/CopY family transcriptional regulator [Bacteroidota bacterium]